MATLDEERTVTDQVELPTAIRQSVDLVNPIMMDKAPTSSSTTHDTVSNSNKQEDVQSLAEKWRYFDTLSIDKSFNGWSYTFDTNTIKNDIGLIIGGFSTDTDCNYVGWRGDLQIKFTLYSSSVQQGALLFSRYNFTPDSKFFELMNKFYLQGYNGPLLAGENLRIQMMTQTDYKLVSLGAETELIVTLPMLTRFDFTPFDYFSYDFSSIFVHYFVPMKTVSGAYDKAPLRIEMRMQNFQLIGSKFNTSDKPQDCALGSYRYKSSKEPDNM